MSSDEHGSSYCGNVEHAIDNRCWLMAEVVGRKGSPVIFDEMMGEYHLNVTFHFNDTDPREETYVLHYCPWCGGRFPESKRGDFFTKPSEDEMASARAALNGLNSLDEVIQRLGPPDEEGDGCDPEIEPWVRWVRYSNIWQTLNLTVGEGKQDGLNWVMAGKYIAPEYRTS